ncbi:fatty acid amide hydrolase-like [Impatiens glandulifera]|uniref:fatty acid amide hydrolase-like n=1 Tax=Impatiens glandulifera TaxID=253017 RepID=UPI001FB0C739|nr:fatty acid amide hydrolase-like [Impatiens glandulifera]
MGMFLTKGVVYKPAAKVDLGPHSDEIYRRAYVKAPRMAGLLVKIFAMFLESRIFGPILLYFLKRNNLIHKLVSYADLEEDPVFVPLQPYEDVKEQDVISIESNLSPSSQVQEAIDCLNPSKTISSNINSSFRRWTILDYSRAYTSGKINPRMVAERFIAAVQQSSEPSLDMSFFISYNVEDILRQANESTLRYETGDQLSALDGVLVAIKDEIDCLPYKTTGGTKWLQNVRSCEDDACCVKRLRLCGAILVGKTNMHELGAGTSGINPHYGATRNPYNRDKISGGSSSGSAAVVAAGLCPVALGVDGGGSVRMPAALCGVIGLKPTFGRVSPSGVLPLNWTVGMVGVLAGTIEDALIVYTAISGELPTADNSTKHYNIHLPILKSPNYISGVRLARYGEWFNDCSKDVGDCCSRAVEKLQHHYGWEVVDVNVPEIEVMRLAHYVTIGSECSNAIACYVEKLGTKEFGWDAKVALSVYQSFSSREYLNAQKIRNRQMQLHKRIFDEADVIVTPTTGVTAYTIYNDALKTGELDYVNGAALVRFSISGNFLGLPAVTVPVGYDKNGLPIGLQFIGKPWSEATLIQIAYAMQALCISECRQPEVFYDLLKEED